MSEQPAPISPFVREIVIEAGETKTASELLSLATGLSRGRIKDAMDKGAVWLGKKRGKRRRLRRASTRPPAGSTLTLYYDETLLSLIPPTPRCVDDEKHYSIWHKPTGLMSQGTEYGDHCSLLRRVELFFKPRREVFLVHRLDREAEGLMLIAHTKEAAARFSRMFVQNKVEKSYLIEVRGNLAAREETVIDLPLDGKSAHTEYTILSHDPDANTSNALVRITTGRLHQIRRHFHLIGHPLMGDPRYGSGNKTDRGLQLIAAELRFICPFSGREMSFSLLAADKHSLKPQKNNFPIALFR